MKKIGEILKEIGSLTDFELNEVLNIQKELLNNKSLLGIFEKDIKYIEDKLIKLSPDTLNQIKTAYERLLKQFCK